MLAAKGTITWIPTQVVQVTLPGTIPGVITHVLHSSLEEMVDVLPSIIGRAVLNPFKKVSTIWVKTGGMNNDAVFNYLALVDQEFKILEVVDLQSVHTEGDTGVEMVLVWKLKD